ncbi:MAG: trigger factor [Bacteroidetes bacterium]|nr:trigger factor [Bacteroidota bacterium]
MNVTIKDISAVKKELHVLVTREELTPFFDKAIKKYQQTAKVPGFRQGKVPLSMIIKLYGPSIQYQELDKIAQEFYQRAFKEANLNPIARPTMKDMNYSAAEELSFVVAYDIKPEIKLPAIKKLNFQQISSEISESDIDAEIDYIKRVSAKMVTDSPNPLGEDDFVVLTIQELDEKDQPTGKKLNNKIFSKRSQEFSAEDQAKILGKKTGESAMVTVLDEGKNRKVLATLSGITSFTMPDFTDEFVKEYTGGKHETVDAFKAELRSGLEKRLARRSESSLQDSVMDEFVAASELEVPESLVEAYLDSMVHDNAHQQKNHEQPKDFNEVEFREKNRDLAIRSAKWWLVKQDIVEKEKITVSEDDFASYLKKVAEEDNIPVETLKKVYAKPENKATIENMIQTQKLVEWAVAQSKVKVVKAEDFKLKVG